MDLLTALARHAIGAVPEVVPASRFAAAGSAIDFNWGISWSDRGVIGGERRTAVDATPPREDHDFVRRDDPRDVAIGSGMGAIATGGSVARPVATMREEGADALTAWSLGEATRAVDALPTGTPGPAKTEHTAEHDGGGTVQPTGASRAAMARAAREAGAGERSDRADDQVAVEIPPVRALSRERSTRRLATDPADGQPGAEPSTREASRPLDGPTVAARDLDLARAAPSDVDTVTAPPYRGDAPGAAAGQVRASDRSGEVAFPVDGSSRVDDERDEAAPSLLAPSGVTSMHPAARRHAGFASFPGFHVVVHPQARGPLSSSTAPAGRSPAIDDRAEMVTGGRGAQSNRSADPHELSIALARFDADAANRGYRDTDTDVFPAGGGAMRLPGATPWGTRATARRSAEPPPPISILSTEPASRTLRNIAPTSTPAPGSALADEARESGRDARTSAGGRYDHRSDAGASVASASHRHSIVTAAACRMGEERHLHARLREIVTKAVELQLPHAVAAPLWTHACRWRLDTISAAVASSSDAIGQVDDGARLVDLSVNDQDGDAVPASGASPAAREPMRSATGAIGGRPPAVSPVYRRRAVPAAMIGHAAEPDRTSAGSYPVATRGTRAGSAAGNSTQSSTANFPYGGEAVSATSALPPASTKPIERRAVGHHPVAPTVAARSDVSRISHGEARTGGDPSCPSIVSVTDDAPSRGRTTAPRVPAGEGREGEADRTVGSTSIPPSNPRGAENARASAPAETPSSPDATGAPLLARDLGDAVQPEQARRSLGAVPTSSATAARTIVASACDALPAFDTPRAGLAAPEHRCASEPGHARAGAILHEAERFADERCIRGQAAATITASVEPSRRDDPVPAFDPPADSDVPVRLTERAARRDADEFGPKDGLPKPCARTRAAEGTCDPERQAPVEQAVAPAAELFRTGGDALSGSARLSRPLASAAEHALELGTVPAGPHPDSAGSGSDSLASDAAAAGARAGDRASAGGEAAHSALGGGDHAPRNPTRRSDAGAARAPLVDSRVGEGTSPSRGDPPRIWFRPAAPTPSPGTVAPHGVESPSVPIDASSGQGRAAERGDTVRIDGVLASPHRAMRSCQGSELTEDHGPIASFRTSGFARPESAAARTVTSPSATGEGFRQRYTAARCLVGPAAADLLLTGRTARLGTGGAAAPVAAVHASVIGLASQPADGVKCKRGGDLAASASPVTAKPQPDDAALRAQAAGNNLLEQPRATPRSRSGATEDLPPRREAGQSEDATRAPRIEARPAETLADGGGIDAVRPVPPTRAIVSASGRLFGEARAGSVDADDGRPLGVSAATGIVTQPRVSDGGTTPSAPADFHSGDDGAVPNGVNSARFGMARIGRGDPPDDDRSAVEAALPGPTVDPARTASSRLVEAARIVADRPQLADMRPVPCQGAGGDGDAPVLDPDTAASPRPTSPQHATTLPTVAQRPAPALAPGDRSDAVATEGVGATTSTRRPSSREPMDNRPVPPSAPIAPHPYAGQVGRPVDAPTDARRRVMRVQTTGAPVLHVGRIRIAPVAIAAGTRGAAAVRAAPTLGLSAYLDRRR